MRCANCSTETTNGLALCDLCQRKVTDGLEFVPIYFRNLARWRPGRAGSRPVPGSRVLWDGERSKGTGDRISDTLDEAANMLTTRARMLTNDRPHFPRPLTLVDAVMTGDPSEETTQALSDDHAKMVALLCVGFTEHLTSISTLDWCGDFVRDLSEHEVKLRGLTEALVPGWYAGACGHCKAPTYVVPGLTWVTCRTCGTATAARDHLETILDEARGWVARPKAMAETLVALLDTEQSVQRLHDRIRQWASRGWLDPVRRLDADGDPTGPNRYRLGEVLDLVTSGAGTCELRTTAV